MSLSEYFDGDKTITLKAATRRARLVALMLSVATFISIISVVFALIQKAQADESREETERLKIDLVEQTEIALRNSREAEVQHAMALAAKEEADRQRAMAMFAEAAANQTKLELLKCKKSK